MLHVKVQSDNIESVAHKGTTLQVKFKNGRVYNYGPVDKAIYVGLLKSASPTEYLKAQTATTPYKRLK